MSGVRTLSSSFFYTQHLFFVLCSTNDVTNYRKSVGENKEEKKILTRGKLDCCEWIEFSLVNIYSVSKDVRM